MTKNQIIRELIKSNPRNIQTLAIIYHNKRLGIKYPYIYECTSDLTLEARRELAKVLLSLYRLRSFVTSISVIYFPLFDGDESVHRSYDSCNAFVYGISEFIECVKCVQTLKK